MTLSMRLILLAIGRETNDRYERAAAQAVRRYLVTLFLCPAVMIIGSILLGRLFFDSWSVGLLIFLSPVWIGSLALVPNVQFGAENESVTPAGTIRFMLGGMNGIPRVPVRVTDDAEVVVHARVGDFRPCIIVHKVLVERLHPLPLLGIFAHELGHIILPCGAYLYEIVTFVCCAIPDLLVLCISQLPDVPFRHKIIRVIWSLSSFNVSHRREQAADMIGALILRDGTPVSLGLALVSLYARSSRGGVLSTHPPTISRQHSLNALQ